MTHDELVDSYLERESTAMDTWEEAVLGPEDPHPFIPYGRLDYRTTEVATGGPPCAHLACGASRANVIHHV